MRITVKTKPFQSMVALATKGASNNKMLPITGMMSISVCDGLLTLTTTDSSNYFFVHEYFDDIALSADEDFSVVVQVEQFAKLISRFTCESIALSLESETLVISGNGRYVIELPLNERGELIVFPDVLSGKTDASEHNYEIDPADIHKIVAVAKPSLATKLEFRCYTGYYVSDTCAVATDTSIMCGVDVSIFPNKAHLISAESMDLLNLIEDDVVTVVETDDSIVFISERCTVYSVPMDCISDYQVDAIMELLHDTYPSVCTVPKTALLQLLDRMSLFVSPYDKNSIRLHFTDDGIVISSKRTSGSELVEYMSRSGSSEFLCYADIVQLRTLVNSNPSDVVEIGYGKDKVLRLVADGVTQVLALTQE